MVPHLWSSKIFASLRSFDWPLYEPPYFANESYKTHFAISSVAFLETITVQDWKCVEGFIYDNADIQLYD